MKTRGGWNKLLRKDFSKPDLTGGDSGNSSCPYSDQGIKELSQRIATRLVDFDNPAKAGTLRVGNACFRNRERAPLLLENMSFDLNVGDCVLLSSDQDAAKTALLDMMAGVYPPTSGDIYVDGNNIGRYSPEALGNHIGYIRTGAQTFRGTIRDNLTGFGRIEEEKTRALAALLEIDCAIERLPSGYDTFMSGSNTAFLPQALKQKIALVPVLVLKPRILLFSSNDRDPDRDSDKLICALLSHLKGKVTMFLASDNRGIQKLADRFFSLGSGRFAEASGAKRALPAQDLSP